VAIRYRKKRTSCLKVRMQHVLADGEGTVRFQRE
jgi:hypothetical protein